MRSLLRKQTFEYFLLKMRFSSLDIFCHVIDNFGDIGVVYRFAKEFKLRHPSCRMRVFCDDLRPLSLLEPAADALRKIQEINGIFYINSCVCDESLFRQLGASDVVIEAFGCEIPVSYQQTLLPQSAVWVNLEHLSAEPWVDGYHQKQSLVGSGTTKKFFYMPGFTDNTGGVIIDSLVGQARAGLVKHRYAFLGRVLADFQIHAHSMERALFGTVFTYLKAFDALLRDLQAVSKDVYLFVCGDKSRRGMIETLRRAGARSVTDSYFINGHVHVLMMPFVSQREFDSLLCVTDFNFVRGEDSLVRAILARRPFLWNAYLQKEKYHRIKVDAFLDVFKPYFDDQSAFGRYRELMLRFNDAAEETALQTTRESYEAFFANFPKLEHATEAMSYFMTRKCNLIEKFTDFLSEI
jgi:uncharacterized repeat protein (TIGR03837 family)